MFFKGDHVKGPEIKKYLQDFNLQGAQKDFESYDFSSICDTHSITSGKIYFCGHKNYWNALLENGEKDLLVIFDQKYFESNKEKLEPELDKFSFWATVEKGPLSMSYLSRPFHDEIVASDNDEVDGRQLGTCDIHPTAIISQNVFLGANVKVGKDVRIHPGTIVSSHCELGDGTVLFPNVTLMPRTTIGKNCRIHSGTVIGSDGFGYNFDKGVHHKVWHYGGVQIGDDVELGSNVCVDQGTFSPTTIGSGTKVDNQVQIAHNVKVEQGVIVCGQGGLAGSSSVGKFTVFGGGARLAPDTHVGDGCQVGGNAGVTTDLEDGAVVAGFPARPIKEWLKGLAYLRKASLKK